MSREKESLDKMGAFEETDLPEGEHTIGLKWVFAYKTDTEGVNIPGKEKAKFVALGFNQWAGQFDDTYALVVKMTSVHVLLAWAAVHDLKIFQLLQLQMIKAIIDSCSFKSPKSDEPRRVQVLDLYCLTRFESESSSKEIVY